MGIKININIADTCIPITVKEEEEETVRAAAKLINEKMIGIKSKYPAIRSADNIAVTLLETAVLYYEESKKSKRYKSIEPEIQELEQILNF